MNIFAIGGDEATGTVSWEQSAREHDNKRVVKMILETAQLLCTTLHLKGLEVPYKPCHQNHPSRLWVGQSYRNFRHTILLGQSLAAEYTTRYKKVHKSEAIIDSFEVLDLSDLFESQEPTKLPLCMPEEFKSPNVVASYRDYFSSKEAIVYDENAVPLWFSERRLIPFQIKSSSGKIHVIDPVSP